MGCAVPIAYATWSWRAVREPGGDDVLRGVARHVRGRPVHLRRVLAAERAAAVRRHPAVAVDDDLAAGEARVGLRPADLEPAGRVHHRRLHPARRRCSGNSRSTGSMTSAIDVGLEEGLDVDLLAVLGGDQDGVDPHRLAVRVLDARPGSCRRAEDTGRRPPCGRRPGAAPAGGPSRSGAASALRSRGRRSRTSCPGRPRRACRARRPEWPSRCSKESSTPRAMSGDCSWIAVTTPHVSPSSPNLALV